MQGADGGDGAPRGGQKTAEPPKTMETVEDNGSAGPRKEESYVVNCARSEHGALVCCKYKILAS